MSHNAEAFALILKNRSNQSVGNQQPQQQHGHQHNKTGHHKPTQHTQHVTTPINSIVPPPAPMLHPSYMTYPTLAPTGTYGYVPGAYPAYYYQQPYYYPPQPVPTGQTTSFPPPPSMMMYSPPQLQIPITATTASLPYYQQSFPAHIDTSHKPITILSTSSTTVTDTTAPIEDTTKQSATIKSGPSSSTSANNVCTTENTDTDPYFCESCDKSFKQIDAYNAHCKTHVKCEYEGCTFIGSKKVVSTHFETSHGAFSGTGYKNIDVEGQSFRVLMGTSPEEVEQWRKERKAMFPTKNRVEVKHNREIELKEAHGHVDKKEENGKRKRGPADRSEDAPRTGKGNKTRRDNPKQEGVSQGKKGTEENKSKFVSLRQQQEEGLYHKLISPDISMEENIILQCIHAVLSTPPTVS